MIIDKNKKFERLYNNLLNAPIEHKNIAFKSLFKFVFRQKEVASYFNMIKSVDNFPELSDPTNFDFVNQPMTIGRELKSQKFKSIEHKMAFHALTLERIYLNNDNFNNILDCLILYESESDSIAENYQMMIKFLFQPIYNFIFDYIEKSGEISFLLMKYKQKREWFYRKKFYQEYLDSGKLEYFLDMDIRSFLFDNGIDYPLSAPVSPTGRVDIISNINSADPLLLEVKFVDKEKGYGKEKIYAGLTQAVNYADDYGKGLVRLVIFNADEKDKKIIIDSNKNNEVFPPILIVNGITIEIFVININPKGKSASEQKKIEEVLITEKELLKNSE